MDEKDSNVYVFERSVDIDYDRLNSVRKSIENERQKAGILMGFIVLALIEGVSHIESMQSLVLRTLTVASFIAAGIFSFLAFRSIRMANSIETDKAFQRDWDKKEQFLRFQHEIITNLSDYQKTELTKISYNILLSACFVGMAMILFSVSIFL